MCAPGFFLRNESGQLSRAASAPRTALAAASLPEGRNALLLRSLLVHLGVGEASSAPQGRACEQSWATAGTAHPWHAVSWKRRTQSHLWGCFGGKRVPPPPRQDGRAKQPPPSQPPVGLQAHVLLPEKGHKAPLCWDIEEQPWGSLPRASGGLCPCPRAGSGFPDGLLRTGLFSTLHLAIEQVQSRGIRAA